MAIRLSLQGNEILGTIQRPQDLQFADSGDLKECRRAAVDLDSGKKPTDGRWSSVNGKECRYPHTDRDALAADHGKYGRGQDGGDEYAPGNAEAETVDAEPGGPQRGCTGALTAFSAKSRCQLQPAIAAHR